MHCGKIAAAKSLDITLHCTALHCCEKYQVQGSRETLNVSRQKFKLMVMIERTVKHKKRLNYNTCYKGVSSVQNMYSNQTFLTQATFCVDVLQSRELLLQSNLTWETKIL